MYPHLLTYKAHMSLLSILIRYLFWGTDQLIMSTELSRISRRVQWRESAFPFSRIFTLRCYRQYSHPVYSRSRCHYCGQSVETAFDKTFALVKSTLLLNRFLCTQFSLPVLWLVFSVFYKARPSLICELFEVIFCIGFCVDFFSMYLTFSLLNSNIFYFLKWIYEFWLYVFFRVLCMYTGTLASLL